MIPLLRFQVMYCYEHRHCSIDYSVELIIIDETCETAFISHWNDFCLISLGKCAPWRRATNRCKKFQFWSFWESPQYKIFEHAFNAKTGNLYYFTAHNKQNKPRVAFQFCIFKETKNNSNYGIWSGSFDARLFYM